jgi:long-chain acyl-CoA synthetase
MSANDARWWDNRDALSRFVCDLVAGELGRLRPGRTPPAFPWALDARLEDELGADSLERFQLATALAEAIHLGRAGVDDSLLAKTTLAEWLETAACGLERFSAELTFRTAGSTGAPKWCVHELRDLEAEVAAHAELLAGARRVIGAVPSHHIYGFLFTILLPLRLDADLIDVRAHVPARLAGLLQPGDVVIGHPDFWRAFVRTVPSVGRGATGVTSTAPCPPDVARAVRAAGFERFVEVYGSSETAGIGWRDDPDAAYTLLGCWRRGATDGELVRADARGEHVFAAPDHLVWEDARHLRPAGRLEGAVQVGGTNVFPDRIGALLRTHPGVAEAAVRLMRPDEGDRLKAFIVPRAEADTANLRADLWTWIDARLTVPERPKSIVFGPHIPVGALGKHADWPIAGADPAAPDKAG